MTSPNASAGAEKLPSITRKAPCQPTLDIPHVRVGTSDAGPVHGLQRLALYAALACAQFRERVPAARVHSIRELVHAIAGLQVVRYGLMVAT